MVNGMRLFNTGEIRVLMGLALRAYVHATGMKSDGSNASIDMHEFSSSVGGLDGVKIMEEFKSKQAQAKSISFRSMPLHYLAEQFCQYEPNRRGEYIQIGVLS